MLTKRFDTLREIETIGALENHYLPKIDRFAKHINKLEDNNDEMRECIKQFEKDILMKYSKAAMIEFQHVDLPQMYMSLDKF